ncbi:ComEC/Rec2 family competence protein [Limnochorda pilosa]|uniref:Competence protein ComEC n=1 Tax=Limnochorda pilosa TaxID=1555112 RepID=A0A0K2SN14_LIMPI|nr:ComEC/Rec2 family competence protein [Limnochorda pilosa]BAS28523.1 competence protein ComEC [Limnochorda pilosa]
MDHGGVARPLVPLFLGALAGSLLGSRLPPALWSVLALPAGALAGTRGRWLARVLAGAAGVGLLASWQAARLPGDVPRLTACQQPLELRGVITGPPEPWRAGWRFPLSLEAVLEGDWRPVTGAVQVRLTLPGLEGPPAEPAALDALGVGAGSRVEVRAELRPPPSGGNPGLFSLRDLMARRGLAAEAWVPHPRFLRPVGNGRGIAAVVEAVRQWSAGRLFQALPPEQAALGAALLLGDRRWLTDDLEDRLRAAGLGHLLAVSGLHVGILAGLAWWLVGGRRARAGAGARAGLTLWLGLLALLTGGAPSVRRAVLMALVGLWAPRGGVDPAQVLAASGLSLLLADPQAARDLGFQLSFAAAGGILILGPRFASALARRAGRVGTSLGYGAAAGMSVAPLTAWHLGEVALWSAPATLVATPLLAVVLVGLLVLACTGGVAPVFLAGAVDLTLKGLLAVADVISGLPGARWTMTRPHPWEIALAAALLFWAARPGARVLPGPFARRRGGLALAAVAALVAWAGVGPGPRLLTVTVLDVGQGDALLVETPLGRRLLLDGGGWPAFGREPPPPDVGERVVVPFLRVLGVTRLDLVASTHPDADHTLGLGAVLDAFPVGLLLHNGWVRPGGPVGILGPWRVEGNRLVRAAPRGRPPGEAPRTVPHRALAAGDRIVLEPGVTLTVLHPPPDGFPDRDANDASLVLRLERGGVRILLLADAEGAAERELLARWGREGLRSDVVKLAHHGAASGAWYPFLEAVAPQVALVSVGAGNRYGHPHPQALAALDRLGVALYRTDRDGALRLEVGQGWARLRALGR